VEDESLRPRREPINLVGALIAVVLALFATVTVSCGTGQSHLAKEPPAPSSPFYVAASTISESWLIRSDGRRYRIRNVQGIQSRTRGVFSPDRAAAIVPGGPFPGPRESWRFAQIVDIGGSSKLVPTRPQTASPVFGPHGEIAYASGTTVYYLDGRTINARGLPKGAEIIKLELSPDDLVVAALVTWDWAGEYPNPSEALYVISPHGKRVVAGDFNALSEQPPDPIWSPSGDEIAFSREVPGRGTVIYVVRSDGSDLKEISQGRRASEPVWSPDGKQLTYTQNNGRPALPRVRWSLVS
jgi:hypothetical protein